MAFANSPFYLGNEDHVEAAEHIEADIHNVMASVCAGNFRGSLGGTEERTQKAGITHSFSVTGKWEQSERGGVFVRSFPVPFFPYLPTSTCFHVPPICYKEEKNLS